MSRKKTAKASARNPRARATHPGTGANGYLRLSMRPLHSLAFLIPFILVYEIGSVLFLSDGERGLVKTIAALKILHSFFQAFGATTFYLADIVLVSVLLVWHVLVRDPWKIRATVLVGMLAESFLWTLPLLVFSVLFNASAVHAAALTNAESLAGLPWQARLTLSVGAGLYEEMLFRLVLIAGAHFVLVDLLRLRPATGGLVAACVSAGAFALYHNVSHDPGGIMWKEAAFFSVAGLYFSAIFLVRGFGIVVAVHAFYDIFVLVVVGTR